MKHMEIWSALCDQAGAECTGGSFLNGRRPFAEAWDDERLHDWLYHSIIWIKHPQGGEFWRHVYKALLDARPRLYVSDVRSPEVARLLRPIRVSRL